MGLMALEILREVKEYDRKGPVYGKRFLDPDFFGLDRVERDRKKRAKWRAAGLCIRCGKPKNPESLSNCDDCLEYRRLRYTSLGKKAGRPTIPRQNLRRKRIKE